MRKQARRGEERRGEERRGEERRGEERRGEERRAEESRGEEKDQTNRKNKQPGAKRKEGRGEGERGRRCQPMSSLLVVAPGMWALALNQFIALRLGANSVGAGLACAPF
jgi:hypothetical protein